MQAKAFEIKLYFSIRKFSVLFIVSVGLIIDWLLSGTSS
ncbi:Uncharacterised protein [Legionella israelensis]|nr:Uncharacterised protein [Legionella israelensis]